MPVFTEADAELLVFTRKEGLLSRLGHDLKLTAGRFRIEVGESDGTQRPIEASCETTSLRLVCALRDGRDDPGELSASDRADIEQKLHRDVLESARYPSARLSAVATAAGTGYELRGTLELHGQRRPVVIAARPSDDRVVAELVLHQPHFGIRPFSAALGALKVHADVRLVVRIPARGL